MTNREQEIVDLIRKNPMITQNELAEKLSITRSSVAVHITNLMKKGIIRGKCYMLNEEPYICVIGGANADIQGFPAKRLVFHDSNPGAVKVSLGGVGRNIAENLSKLGMPVKLITAVGNDVYGKDIIENARISQMDVAHTLISSELPTSVYLSILDADGDMLAAIAQMDIIEKIDPDFLSHKAQLIRGAHLCVLDANLSAQTLEYIAEHLKGADLYVDTVSTAKAVKIRPILSAIHTLKPNRLEAAALSGINITDDESLRKNGAFFLSRGVKRVVISLGLSGVYYHDGVNEFVFKPKDVRVVNATGAGDAFMAAFIYGSTNGFEAEKLINFSTAASKLALIHEKTINPNSSVENITKNMEETIYVRRLS